MSGRGTTARKAESVVSAVIQAGRARVSQPPATAAPAPASRMVPEIASSRQGRYYCQCDEVASGRGSSPDLAAASRRIGELGATFCVERASRCSPDLTQPRLSRARSRRRHHGARRARRCWSASSSIGGRRLDLTTTRKRGAARCIRRVRRGPRGRARSARDATQSSGPPGRAPRAGRA